VERRRQDKVKCRICGSHDIWRIGSVRENALMRLLHKGRKLHQCRACRHEFYMHSRRLSDKLSPVELFPRKDGYSTRWICAWTIGIGITTMLILEMWGLGR